MIAKPPVSIVAVAGPVVNAAAATAVARIEAALAEAGCERAVFAVTPADAIPADVGEGPRAHLLTTLADEAETLDDAWDAVEARVRARIAAARAVADKVFLCTVLRAAPASMPEDARRRLVARLRRLDLLAVRLSGELGIFVVDLDRALGGIGAIAYATDHRLGGAHAAEAVAHEIAATLMASGLDLAVPFAHRDRVRDLITGWVPPTAIDPVCANRPNRPIRTAWTRPANQPRGLWPHVLDVLRRRQSPWSLVVEIAAMAVRGVAAARRRHRPS